MQRLDRDEWWKSVRHALDDLDAEQAASCQAESHALDAVAADGLVGAPGRQSPDASG